MRMFLFVANRSFSANSSMNMFVCLGLFVANRSISAKPSIEILIYLGLFVANRDLMKLSARLSERLDLSLLQIELLADSGAMNLYRFISVANRTFRGIGPRTIALSIYISLLQIELLHR